MKELKNKLEALNMELSNKNYVTLLKVKEILDAMMMINVINAVVKEGINIDAITAMRIKELK